MQKTIWTHALSPCLRLLDSNTFIGVIYLLGFLRKVDQMERVLNSSAVFHKGVLLIRCVWYVDGAERTWRESATTRYSVHINSGYLESYTSHQTPSDTASC